MSWGPVVVPTAGMKKPLPDLHQAGRSCLLDDLGWRYGCQDEVARIQVCDFDILHGQSIAVAEVEHGVRHDLNASSDDVEKVSYADHPGEIYRIIVALQKIKDRVRTVSRGIGEDVFAEATSERVDARAAV
jgi:hypothetical protein